MVKPDEERKKTYKPTLRIRVRRTVGFALGVSALALIDMRYHFWPRITGKLRGGSQKKS